MGIARVTIPSAQPGATEARAAMPHSTAQAPSAEANILPWQGLRGIGGRRSGASEIEVASGLGIDRTTSGSHWPSEVDGAPVDYAAWTPTDVQALVHSLEQRLGPRATQRAKRDQHSRRKPIPCGVPLITGHSCDYACRYCYIQDWYPFVPPTPSELSGDEVLLSLLYNSHWVPS